MVIHNIHQEPKEAQVSIKDFQPSQRSTFIYKQNSGTEQLISYKLLVVLSHVVKSHISSVPPRT